MLPVVPIGDDQSPLVVPSDIVTSSSAIDRVDDGGCELDFVRVIRRAVLTGSETIDILSRVVTVNPESSALSVSTVYKTKVVPPTWMEVSISYVKVSSEGMGHWVTPTAPSNQLVLLKNMPCECKAVPRLASPRPLVACIRMMSPVVEWTAGGGQVPLTPMTLLSNSPSGLAVAYVMFHQCSTIAALAAVARAASASIFEAERMVRGRMESRGGEEGKVEARREGGKYASRSRVGFQNEKSEQEEEDKMAQDRFDSFDMYLYPKSGHDAGQGCKPGTPKKREKPDRPDDQGGRGGLGFVSDCKLGLMTSCLGLFDRVGVRYKNRSYRFGVFSSLLLLGLAKCAMCLIVESWKFSVGRCVLGTG